MLIRFSVENFKSFESKNILNLQAGNIKEYPINVFSSPLRPDFKVLKSCALYGLNNSGKTNLLKAIIFCRDIITSNLDRILPNNTKVYCFKLNDLGKESSTDFEFTILLNDVVYRYGFGLLKNRIIAEYLFVTQKSKEEQIFFRSADGYSYGKRLKQDLKQKLNFLNDLTRPDSLFLSVLAKFNFTIAIDIIEWFQGILAYDDSQLDNWIQLTATLMQKDDFYNSRIQHIVRKLRLGIDGIDAKIKEQAARTGYAEGFLQLIQDTNISFHSINAIHKTFNYENKITGTIDFDLFEDESTGTQKVFAMLGPIFFALKNRTLLLIDEIDAKLHPNLIEPLISAFHTDSLNVVGSQIVFTAQNSNLLNKSLRRDQMVFFTKDEFGKSIFKSLYEKSPSTRNDASFEKDYLGGKYTDMPKIDNQLDLFSAGSDDAI